MLGRVNEDLVRFVLTLITFLASELRASDPSWINYEKSPLFVFSPLMYRVETAIWIILGLTIALEHIV